MIIFVCLLKGASIFICQGLTLFLIVSRHLHVHTFTYKTRDFYLEGRGKLNVVVPCAKLTL